MTYVGRCVIISRGATGVTTIFTGIRIIALLLGIVVFSNGNIAISDTVDTATSNEQARKQEAQSYFSLGEAHFEAGEYKEAAEAFTKAYDTMPHYTVLANIGLAAERSGDYVLAVISFRKYLAALDKAGKENTQIEILLQQTLRKVSELIISTDGGCDACHIRIDSVDRGNGSARVVVMPGEHRIELIRDGEIQFSRVLSVSPGETRQFTIVEPSEENDVQTAVISNVAAPVETKDTMKDVQTPQLTVPLRVALGTSIGASIVAGIMWGAAVSTKKDFDSTDPLGDRDDKERLQQKGERQQISAVIATGIAGAAGLTAVILAVVRKQRAHPRKNDSVSVSYSGNAIGVGVRF